MLVLDISDNVLISDLRDDILYIICEMFLLPILKHLSKLIQSFVSHPDSRFQGCILATCVCPGQKRKARDRRAKIFSHCLMRIIGFNSFFANIKSKLNILSHNLSNTFDNTILSGKYSANLTNLQKYVLFSTILYVLITKRV